MSLRKPLFAASLSALVALIVYAPVLHIPLIYDTLLHIRIAEDLNLFNVWLPTEAFGFFRPMTFVPVILTRQLFGYFPTWFFNGMSWVQHAFNAAALAWLLYRATKNEWQAAITGLLFATFPFTYQAIGVYGHNVHPAIVGLVLIGLHLFWSRLEWRTVIGIRYSVFGLACIVILGFLTHESFILFGPLCVLLTLHHVRVESLQTLLARWRQFVPAVTLTIIGIAYVIVYQFLPISRAPQAEAVASSIEPKLLYLLQAVAYPLTWFGHRLPHVSARILVVAAFALVCLLTIRNLRYQWQSLLFGWGWWLAASVIIAVPLSTNYLLNGPRLLYLSSVGITMIWAIILTPRLTSGRWIQGLQLIALAFVLITSVQFTRARLANYAELTSGIGVLEREADQSGGVLLVNLTEWLAPPETTYPVGAEFVQQLGFYLFAEEWVNHNLNSTMPTRAIKVDELLAQTPYGYDVHEQHVAEIVEAGWEPAGSDVFVTRYLEDGIVMEKFGRFQPQPNTPPIATIPPYTVLNTQATFCNGEVIVISEWDLLTDTAPLPTNSLFVQLLDENGVLIAQTDRPPLGIRPDLIDLPDNFSMQDQRILTVESGTPATVLIGVYDFMTAERAPAQDTNGAPVVDNALRVPVEHCR